MARCGVPVRSALFGYNKLKSFATSWYEGGGQKQAMDGYFGSRTR